MEHPDHYAGLAEDALATEDGLPQTNQTRWDRAELRERALVYAGLAQAAATENLRKDLEHRHQHPDWPR
jgi:hypothetical protein